MIPSPLSYISYTSIFLHPFPSFFLPTSGSALPPPHHHHQQWPQALGVVDKVVHLVKTTGGLGWVGCKTSQGSGRGPQWLTGTSPPPSFTHPAFFFFFADVFEFLMSRGSLFRSFLKVPIAYVNVFKHSGAGWEKWVGGKDREGREEEREMEEVSTPWRKASPQPLKTTRCMAPLAN